MKQSMLTTIDNPFNPFKQFDEWMSYDTIKGYNSCAYLARIVRSSQELSPNDQSFLIDQAIDEIIHYNINGMYKKVVSDE